MIPRYTRPAMAAVWSPLRRYRLWLEVELAAMEGWAEIGVIPREAVLAVRERARIAARGDPAGGVTVERIEEIEREVHHDLIAFTTAVAEAVGEPARWFHYGLTSSDVVDTAQALQLREAADLLLAGLDRLLAALAEKARAFKDQVVIGRTHGVHAEPTTLGLKFASLHAELARGRTRLERAREAVSVGQISGAVGTYGDVDPRVEAHVLRKLGLRPETVATQVVARDRHAEFLCALAVVGGGVERLAVEVRHLQRTEVRELEEPFRPGQKGSSAMPHKRNPEKCERLTGLARLLRAYAQAALEDQALWHERDISHSSVERVVLPDATIVLDYMLDLATTVVAGLRAYPENMRRNLELTGGLVFSPRVMLALVERGLSRERAYAIVQAEAMAAWEGGPTFAERIRRHPEVRARLSDEEIEACFDPRPYLRHVDFILRRAGILPEGEEG
ncbi:MAG: adenylosuccinate lyase [Clostridia bacterium]|nr:adenylosuccinate lyase [Clostridia bacterium]